MKQLDKDFVEKACWAAGRAAPPELRYPIRQYKHHSSVHPCDRKYSSQPAPEQHSIDADVPAESGVYFFWRRSLPFYVGQAVSLQQRLKSHPMKKYCDEVAWVLCNQDDLNFAESIYMGLLRPLGNFGSIKTVRCDQGETYFYEERIGETVLRRTGLYRQPVESPVPEGAIIQFPRNSR
jgi:hypothetical protein